jgi:catechol 2,3-dioxygenase-like lactoylglutathione lyase family enzyme
MFTQCNVTVMVSDLQRALAFYTETLGLPLKSRSGDEWAEVQGPGVVIGLHKASGKGPKPGTQGSLSIGLGVQNLELAMAELRKRGVQFQGPVVSDGPVKLAFFGDPDRNPLYLCELPPPEGPWD